MRNSTLFFPLALFLISASPLLLKTTSAQAAPVVDENSIATNASDYLNNQIPKYEKFEITFNVQTSAGNPQFPYDPSPPIGDDGNTAAYDGITVNAVFQYLDDSAEPLHRQPAFYFQEYAEDPNHPYKVLQKNNKEWFYPTGRFYWKVRFAPHQKGNWQFKLQAQDKDNDPGWTQTTWQTFSVSDSTHHGFVKVNDQDARYFEFDDGTYFPNLGYNLPSARVDWINPIGDKRTGNKSNTYTFQKMEENGIQFARIWLSEWSIFGASWNPWVEIRNNYGGYVPREGLSIIDDGAGKRAVLQLSYGETLDAVTGAVTKNTDWFDACRFNGFQSGLAIKQNTDYFFRVKYKAMNMTGPRNSAYPDYGFVVKFAEWDPNCFEPGVGTVITHYGQNTNDQWEYVSGSWNSGNRDFLPNVHLVLENVHPQNTLLGRLRPAVFIDTVEIREDLGSGQYGPNIVTKPSMEHHLQFEQRDSYAFDKVLELAHGNGIYLRANIMEKQDWILQHIDSSGFYTASGSPNNFYGSGSSRNITKVRWLQRAWWRYLQARWGYSTNIHSWELMNEGDPYHGGHYVLADELGKVMHNEIFCVDPGSTVNQCPSDYDHPNDHLVSTSFWHSFPVDRVWADLETKYAGQQFADGSPIINQYPHIDFADVHKYISDIASGNSSVRIDILNLSSSTPYQTSQSNFSYNPNHYYDAALATQKLSTTIGAYAPKGARKPVIRGETGFGDDVKADTQGIWLHNYIWAQINPGGLIESYWYATEHIYYNWDNTQKQYLVDHRHHFKPYYDFIRTIPLSNGRYVDAAATSPAISDGSLRAWGQKDLFNGNAHLWIQNAQHTWGNMVNNVPITPISDTITISGFDPTKSYTLEFWDPYQTDLTKQPLRTEAVMVQSDGSIVLPIQQLDSDVAIKIKAAAIDCLGDVTQDRSRDLSDVIRCIRYLVGLDTLTGSELAAADANQDGSVDLSDVIRLIRDLLGLEPLPVCQ